jgi:hypothetical protein
MLEGSRGKKSLYTGKEEQERAGFPLLPLFCSIWASSHGMVTRPHSGQVFPTQFPYQSSKTLHRHNQKQCVARSLSTPTSSPADTPNQPGPDWEVLRQPHRASLGPKTLWELFRKLSTFFTWKGTEVAEREPVEQNRPRSLDNEPGQDKPKGTLQRGTQGTVGISARSQHGQKILKGTQVPMLYSCPSLA